MLRYSVRHRHPASIEHTPLRSDIDTPLRSDIDTPLRSDIDTPLGPGQSRLGVLSRKFVGHQELEAPDPRSLFMLGLA